MGPHSLVAGPAELMAWHRVFAGPAECCADLRYETGHHHCIDVGVWQKKPVNDIGTGKAELHRSISGHEHAIRYKTILLGDQSRSYRTVRLDC